MCETVDPCVLESLLQEKLAIGEDLLSSLATPEMQGVDGIAKLEKKIRQEVKFLQKFAKGKGKLKKEHLQCSNLQHLSAIVRVLLDCEAPQAVLHSFALNEHNEDFDETKKVTVDVVSEGGLTWTKVIARNPKALDLNSSGGNQFGQRSIMDQVREFLTSARQNTKMFRVPEVVFVFHNGVSDVLAKRLTAKGLVVKGNIIPSQNPHLDFDSEESDSDVSESEDDDERVDEEDLPHIDYASSGQLDSSTLNLDITAMIAYVSALTNGHADHTFKEPILSDQAMWEKRRPVRPVLESLFHDKKLVCCHSAMRDFQTILNTLGGEGEKRRAKALIARMTVVPDQMSNRLAHLDMSGKIKERSRAIFGTGDQLKVVTVTANSGFVRAARGQGVDLAVILHESRALTEDKMQQGPVVVSAAAVAQGRED